jgi:2',3'-cyclic-nucleotide 2'-phosphodiesterase (5'-nucleotidase family)
MNATGYDALTVGNHEFDYGYENLQRLAGATRFPFLGANVHLRNSAQPPEFLHPFVIKEYPGLTVAVIGLANEETGVITLPQNVDEMVFSEPESAVRFYLPLLAERGVDLLIVLSHLGLEEDRELARAVPEIDVIIGGHSHDLISHPRREAGGRTLICQAGEYGLHAGRLDLRVDKRKGGVASQRYRLFNNRKGILPPDPDIEHLLEKIKNEVGTDLGRQVGTAKADLFPPEDGESPLGNLLADAIREAARTDVAFHNAYGIRAPLFEGPITLRDLYLVMPFDNTIVTMEFTGRQIREVIEQSLTLKKGMLQVSGLRAEYSPQREAGKRLIRLEIAGEEVREDALYSVAVNSFLAEGGDYFQIFTAGAATRDTEIPVREALAETVRRHTPLSITHLGPERLVPQR